MASIYNLTANYSETDLVSGIVKYNTLDNAGTNTGTTATLDLNRFLYQPYNEATMYSIRNEINQYAASVAATDTTGLYTSGSATSDVGTITTGNVSDYFFNPVDNSFNIRMNFSEEERKVYEEAGKEREKERQRLLKQQKIRNNLLIRIKSRGITPRQEIPENEQIARDTLREYITEEEFRKYLRFGFICVDGQEGKTYQIFRSSSHTKVWKGGRVIEEICVHIKNKNVPPTDEVIAFRTMIKTSEKDFRKLGNVYNMRRAA